MSHSPKQAIDDREQEVFEALNSKDSEAIYHLADLFKEEGEDERAEELLKIARRWNDEDWSYDESINN